MKHFIISFYYKPTLDKLKKLYKYNFDFNKTYSYLSGQSLIHVKQSYETMKYMLDRGGNPNINCTMYGLKPIHFQKEYKVIKLLIDRRAIPNPVDFNNFNPLFWQKDPESMKYLLNHNKIYNCNIIVNTILFPIRSPYMRMLIEGGYDPYNEKNISITPVFLQRNLETLDILLDHCYMNNINNVDIINETLLFKSCINSDVIRIYWENNQNLDHQNVLGNTALHVQSEPYNILELLKFDADHKIKNISGDTPYQYHKNKNNILNYMLIERYSSAKLIQQCWRRFWYNKTYIPPKYYKIKLSFMNEFTLLPPSECGIFPGGIEYQNAYDNFKSY